MKRKMVLRNCPIIGLFTVLLAAPLLSQVAVSGSGTTNYIPIWTSSTNLSNSAFYQTGGRVGLATTTPGAKLEVDQNAFGSGLGAIFGLTTDINAAGVSGKATRFSPSAVGVAGTALVTGVTGTSTDPRRFFNHY